MKKKNILILVFTMMSAFLFAQPKNPNQEWAVSSSTVTFTIKNAGFSIDGKLGPVSAKIQFDAAKAFGNVIEAQIDSKTINTDNSTRDNHLRKPEYFDVEHYPTISLKANVFSKEKDGTYKGFFKLTLKNKTKDVVIPFSFKEKDGKGVFEGEFEINRLDYTVGESSMILSDQVKIKIVANVIKK